MQRTLDKLVVWANRWEMEFNVNKCGIMLFILNAAFVNMTFNDCGFVGWGLFFLIQQP